MSARSVVVVHDPREERARTLNEALAGSRLTARWVPDRMALARLDRVEDCWIALVAVGGEPDAALAVLDAVASLKQKGFTVFCYWAGPGQWAMGARCRLLLAGASHLLDGTEASFAAGLRLRLERLVAAEAAQRRDELRMRQQMLDQGVVGSGPGICGVFRWILRVAPLSSLPVLVVGETGTGKELVARAIHRLDPRRRQGPFVPVNCAAISAGLAESELFGHRRGAFTGAEHDRKGLVRAAAGGVLFLDEIGDLDAGLQGKLLRVLQEHRVLALGEDQEVAVDVRIVAATNRDLEDMVRRHAFRADLFHRLDVLSVRVPSLRERPEDIEPLVQHFIARFDPSPRTVDASAEFLQALRGVELPGNVRQLESIVHRAMLARKPDAPLQLSDLPPELWSQLARAGESAGPMSPPLAPTPEPAVTGAREESKRPAATLLDAVGVLEASSWKLGRALDLCEQTILTAALGASRGNRSRAARMLGISPRSIFNKMRKYHLAS